MYEINLNNKDNGFIHNPNDKPSEGRTTQENNDDNDTGIGSERQENQIKNTGSIIADTGKYVIHCLTIIGQIEGHYILPAQNKTTKYEHVIPQLIAIEEEPKIDGLLIILNTVGGDVEAGLAIAELIAGLSKPTVSMVLGGGHSIGVPLAVAADKSFIAKSATMTIHPVRMSGLVLGVPQTLEYFQKMQERITKFITDNSHMKAERFKELSMETQELLMDVGSMLNGDEAVKEGLIDYVGNLSDALNCLYSMIDEKKLSENSENHDNKDKSIKSKDTINKNKKIKKEKKNKKDNGDN